MSKLMEKGPMTRNIEKAFLLGDKDMLASGERRTFGQVLEELLEKCSARRTDGFSKKKLIDDLAVSPFNDGETKRSSVEKKISRWLKDEARPEDRALLFQLCIIMKLTEEEARYLFERGLMASWIHWANRNELIYDFCLKMGYDIDKTYELINSENGIKGAGGRGASMRMSISEHSTKMIGAEYGRLTDDWEDMDEEEKIESFNDFLRQNAHYFRAVSKTRRNRFRKFYEKYEQKKRTDPSKSTSSVDYDALYYEDIIEEAAAAQKKFGDVFLANIDPVSADIVRRAMDLAVKGEEGMGIHKGSLNSDTWKQYVEDAIEAEASAKGGNGKLKIIEIADILRVMRLPDAGDLKSLEGGDENAKAYKDSVKRIKKIIYDDKSGTDNPMRHDVSDYLKGKKDVPRDVLIKMYILTNTPDMSGAGDVDNQELVNDMKYDLESMLMECGYPGIYVRAADGFDAVVFQTFSRMMDLDEEDYDNGYEITYKRAVNEVIDYMISFIE
ncbi:MAG: hypothetical protein IIW34_00875 [Clostridia bacterium]|nr:hypothetical protein [Clostridia bacterium]MBQ2327074.1 hypothetical protein [Clostridia bacterium]MBQ5812685.1 hypothetical protein [Clostridia bacterium]